MKHKNALLAGGLLLAVGLAVGADPAAADPVAAADEITLEKIMADPDWIGNAPESPFWSADGRSVYYERKRAGTKRSDLWRVDLGGKAEPRKLDAREKAAAETGDGSYSQDRRLKVYVREGDLYLREADGRLRQLTRTAAEESAPRFLLGDRRVAFRRGPETFVRDLDSGLEWQPAQLLLEKDPAAQGDDGSYLPVGQQRLFEVLRQRRQEADAARREAREAREADPTLAPLPWYLGDGVEALETSLSPDARWMLVLLAKKERDEGKEDDMPRFVTDSGYVETEKVRPKVGTDKPESPTLLLLDLRAHRRHEIDLSPLPGLRDDPLAELRKAAEAERKAAKDRRRAERRALGDEVSEEKAEGKREGEGAGAEPEKQTTESGGKAADVEKREGTENQTAEAAGTEGEEKEKAAEDGKEGKEPEARPVTVSNPIWSDDGSQVALQIESADNKDRWLARVDLAEARLVPLERLSDPAWVSWDLNQFGWLRDNRTLWYLSEESGWSHLYLRPLDDSKGGKRQLTRGEFEVSSPVLSRDGRTFYVLANREHPGVYEVYRLKLGTGDPLLERLTRLEGGLSDFAVSPDERRLLYLHSKPTRPPELYVQDLSPGAEARRLSDTVSPAFAAVRWSEPEVVPIPSSHAGRPIWSRVYKPAGWTPDRRWPAVVFVHGAGYLQNAHKGWSSYFREFMFHSLLTRQGYVVLDMDYRASAGYGRDWRTAIYRQMGFPEVEDLEDGVAWLAAHRSVDRARVGVYGGSYGGFLTFMSLFRKPDLFACGAALRPVTDWAHYNQGYTSAILNTPEVDPEAYRKSSPIEYAEGLSKPLLIAHGMVDDNVVFQDTVRLVQRLIELKKENFETAIYPVEPHGFQEPTSWLDEYRRIYKLMEANLK